MLISASNKRPPTQRPPQCDLNIEGTRKFAFFFCIVRNPTDDQAIGTVRQGSGFASYCSL